MKNKKQQKILAIFSTLAIIISMMSIMSFPASATDDDVYEIESNNTYATAGVAYDESDNIGAISTTGDVDWWKITYNTGGMVNIWLGYIPSGCNYDMSLYRVNANGVCDAKPCIASVRTSGTQEFMRMRIYPGETVAVRIVSASGYSASQYMLCFKRYDVGKMRFFNYETSGDLDASALIETVKTSYETCGYTTYSFRNASAAAIYNALPNTSIAYTLGHASSGYIDAGSHTMLFAKYYDTNGENNRALESYASEALTDVNLLIFAGCQTGETSYYGNLVSMALTKGARCCIGWDENINQLVTQIWLEEFTQALCSGLSVKYAIIEADTWTKERCGETYSAVYPAITSHEVGLSPTWSYILG